MKNIKLIIFDLDGTLVDAYPAIISSFNFTMRRLNYPPQNNLIIRRAVGWGDERLLAPFVNSEDLKKAVFLYRKHHKIALLRGAHLFPKVEKLLRTLRGKGYKLAVASNRPTRFSLILIRHFGLNRYFDYVLCADRLKHIKPHPEILNKIRHRFRLKAAEVLYVGDMTIDAQAAGRARVKVIMVTTGSSTLKEIKKEKPYRIIRKVADLLKIL